MPGSSQSVRYNCPLAPAESDGTHDGLFPHGSTTHHRRQGGLRFDPGTALTPDYNLAAFQEVAEGEDSEGQEQRPDPGARRTGPPVGIALPNIKSAE